MFDREKLRAAVLHVIGACNPERLGAVKLHKVLYYSDMLLFLETGNPITGAVYRKRPFGPTCDAALGTLSDLDREGAISVDIVDYHGYQKKQFRLNAPADTNHLSGVEKAVLDEMVEFVCNSNSAKTISEFSHDMVWEMVEFGDVIPYHNAIHLIPSVPSQDALDWAAAEAESIASTGLGTTPEGPVAGSRGSAIRARLAELSRQ
ncbi:MAG: Panacea domain-containing protein [Rhizobiaceae bacterium]